MTSSLAADFIAGVDPFGIYTSQYGQRAEQAGLSEGQHRVKQLAGAAGGVIGSGLLVPSAVTGIIGGVREAASSGGGRAGRLAAFAKGFAKGVKKPVQGLSDVYQVRKAARGAKDSGRIRLTTKQKDAFKRLGEDARLTDVFSSKGSLSGAPGALFDYSTGTLSRGTANLLAPQMASATNFALTPVAIGATVGAGGAMFQYGRGRQQERKFQRRSSNMYKMSSVATAALQAGYIHELEKISASPSRAAGQVVGRLYRKAKRVANTPQRMYQSYREGFDEGSARSIAEYLGDLGKDLKKMNYGKLAIPAVIGVAGLGTGAALGKANSGGGY